MTRITSTLHDRLGTFMIISRLILIRYISDKFVEKIKTHILCSITIFRKSCRLWDGVEKCGRARQATDSNVGSRMRVACMIRVYDVLCTLYTTCFLFCVKDLVMRKRGLRIVSNWAIHRAFRARRFVIYTVAEHF
jgi:hypothetical protein